MFTKANDILRAKLDEHKQSLFGWVGAVESNTTSDVQSCKNHAYDDTVVIASCEHTLDLIDAARGLNPKIVKQLVDTHYREYFKLDENGNHLPDPKS